MPLLNELEEIEDLSLPRIPLSRQRLSAGRQHADDGAWQRWGCVICVLIAACVVCGSAAAVLRLVEWMLR